MDKQDPYYMPEEVPASWKFELLGHAEKTIGDTTVLNMLGVEEQGWENGWPVDKQYPGWVVPVGNLEGKFAGIYLQRNGVVHGSWTMGDSPTVVRYSPELREKLSGYDYRHHCLFAFSRDEVIYHDDTPSEELKITRKVLSDERFREKDPFVRLSIATRSKDHGLVLIELRRCVKLLWTENPDYCKAIYQATIDCMKRPEEQLGDGMPDLARMLEQPGALESLLTEN